MRVVPPTELRMQCPSCGQPVEVFDGSTPGQARLEPCGHVFTLAELSVTA